MHVDSDDFAGVPPAHSTTTTIAKVDLRDQLKPLRQTAPWAGGDRGHLIILLAMLLFFTACSSRELVSVARRPKKKKKSDALIHDVTAACSFNEEVRPAVVMGLVSDGGGITEGDMWKYLLR